MNQALLAQGAEQMGLTLPEDYTAKLELFLSELLRWNEMINLTAITDPDEMCTKHCLDSLSLLPLLPQGASLIDVGCGAGFPSVPVALARPDLQVTLLDGVNKKLNFLRETLPQLGLTAQIVHGRAEELARKTPFREGFQVAVARAVAALPVLCELCLPLVKPGGCMIAMKGPAAGEELASAQRAITLLGGSLEERREVSIPFTDLTHNLIVIRKVRGTPSTYPRQSAKIVKQPL